MPAAFLVAGGIIRLAPLTGPDRLQPGGAVAAGLGWRCYAPLYTVILELASRYCMTR